MIYHLFFSFCCFALVELSSSLNPSHEKLCCLSLSFPSRLLFSDANTDEAGHMNNICLLLLCSLQQLYSMCRRRIKAIYHLITSCTSDIDDIFATQRINHGERTVATKSNLKSQTSTTELSVIAKKRGGK